MSQIEKTNSITKAELEAIRDKYRQRRYDECLREVKSKLKQSPNSLHLLNYQAMAYSALKRDKEALSSYLKIIKKDPTLAGPYYNMGVILKRNERLEEAIDHYKKAISLKADYVQAYNNLGVLYKDSEKYEDAIKMFMKAKELQPDHQNSYYNLALIKKEQGLYEEAIEFLLMVLDLNSDHSEANYLSWLIYSRLGQFTKGWKYFEYRWKVSPQNGVIWPIQDKPLWKGEKGKHVVVWQEQGIGDQIIFLSLLPEVKEMCSRLSVYVDPRLHALCKRTMPDIDFVKDEEELKKVESDYYLPLGSVPGLIRNDISDFDRTVTGYFKADPQRVEAIRNELGLGNKTVIGISWKSFKSLNQVKKSIQLRDFERIFSGLDVVLVNLQYGDVDEEIREFKEVTGIDVVQCASVDNREDLDGLAALIEVCDLVVSTSNVTIHMAGALAKETWALLHYVSIYYWLVERTDSIWYPSLTLYRQPTLDDWDSVYEAIRNDLQTRLTIT